MEEPAVARLTPAGLAANVERVRERVARACARAGRSATDVTLIAATKTQLPATVAAAWHAGIRDFGENRVQEALAKQPEVAALLPPGASPRWHLIGHLQTNKAKAAARAFAILHGIDSARLIDAVGQAAQGQQLPIMIEVNVAGDPAKHGIAPGALAELVAHARAASGVRLEGLMTVAPWSPDPEAARPVFRELRALADAHGLPSLSMGMTEDFEVAIEEGATHIRVGRAIFGERQL
ncbi:MAG: YggS family pyridoxal phosphate-dependent enzyme [Dehalococcoidia bacterium]|nr:YggS family pyridoxal phosphate-dependent enzyme [Dehalococcoidia bacterium]